MFLFLFKELCHFKKMFARIVPTYSKYIVGKYLIIYFYFQMGKLVNITFDVFNPFLRLRWQP